MATTSLPSQLDEQTWSGAAAPVPTVPAAPTRWRRAVRGRLTDPGWVRPALVALLIGTAVLYVWGLGSSGWANSFYSAAVQAGSVSWKALFYGSSDASNSITVDKPPASLWVMAMSVRVFGLNSWSILVPQALEGVAAVGVLYLAVRRWAGPTAGLIAGAVLALTPVAVLMFRFNNPDALLVLLLVGAAYAVLRAVEVASTRWLLFAATLVGFGFLTKMLQALLVLPAFGLVYLVAAPTPLRRRIGQLLLAGVTLVVAGGWWVAIVELVPAADRPFIGGSQTNSVLELVLGYNGLGRLTGNETGSVGGGSGWGITGLMRMFGSEVGGQVAWLLPAALLLAVAGFWVTRGAPRTDMARAALLLWSGWLLVTGVVFSLMQGIFHAYYTVALAPAIGALVGIGATMLWRRRAHVAARFALAVVLGWTAIWSFTLLGRSSDYLPWLAPTVLVLGVAAAVLLVVTPVAVRRGAALVAGVAVVVGLAGPSAYAVTTAAVAHTGSIPSAGPSASGGFGGFGAFGGAVPAGVPGGLPTGAQGRGGFPIGAAPPPGAGTAPQRAGRTAGVGRAGGLLDSSEPAAALTALLEQDGASYTWVAAAVGSNNASGYQLATGLPVMAIGGFNGSDPSPTLAQFQADVAAGRIHYFIGGGVGGGGQSGGSSAATTIRAWVQQTFTAQTVGGVTVYDLGGRS